MKILLSCPSKSFLLGEYSVLNAGSALLFNSEPRFQLVADMRGTGVIEGIPAGSPAGLWLAQNRDCFGASDLQFIDPHNGLGGFGASSAQFLLVHALAQLIADANGRRESSAVQVEAIWRDYRNLEITNRSGIKPSGADIVSQFAGGLCEVNLEPFSFQQISWPFEGYEFVLVRTGHKVATHTHLNDLGDIDTGELTWILEQGLDAFETRDAQVFFDAVNDYHCELLELGLVADESQIFISTLIAQPFIRAVKGCGALSGDALAVFFAAENRSRVNRILEELHLPIVADLGALSTGFQMQIDDSDKPASIEGAGVLTGV